MTIDFSAVTTENDVVTIVSTEPLTTNETWRALDPGESLLLVDGEIVACYTSAGAEDLRGNLRPENQ